MADILASVSVVLGAEISGFRAAMADARKELRGLVTFSEGLQDIGKSLTAYVSAPLLLVGGAAVKMAGDMEKAKASFTTMLGSASAATATLQDLKQFAANTPFEFPEIQNAAKKLLAFNTPAKDLKETLRQLGDVSSGIDAPIGEIAELFGKARVQGRLFQEDINQLTGRGIPIIQELAKQFHVTEDGVRGLVTAGKVNFKNLQTAFADLTAEGGRFGGLMEAQSQTIPGLFSNLADNSGQALAALGADIAQTFNLKGVLSGLASFVQSASSAFESLAPATKGLVIGLAGIAAAVGPVLVVVGSLGAALPAITAGFEVLGVGSLAALGPILPVVAAVAAAAYLVIDNWSAVSAYFRSSEVTGLFNDLATAAGSMASAVGEAFSTLRANLATNLGDMVGAIGFLRDAFRQMAVTTTGVLDVLAGTIRGLNGLLTGDTVTAVDGAKQAFFGLVDPIANLFGFSKKAPTDSGIYILTQQAKEFNAVGPQFAANLALLNGVRLDVVAQQAGDAAKKIGLLADLEERLKAAKDAKPNLSTEAEIAAQNQLIASLEAQIAKLNALGIASKEMQKAYADVQKSLRTVAQESLALGDQYDYLKNRQSATESGIKKLIAAGFSPASNAVRTLVADLRTLNNTLGDNSLLEGRKLKGTEKFAETPEFKVPTLEPLKLPEVLLPDYGAIFGNAAKGIADGNGALQAAFEPVTQAQLDFNTQMGELIDAFPSAGLVSIGQSIGDALASGSDILAAAGQAVLKTLASFVSEYGRIVVAKGVADIALGNVGQGLAEIAGGVALIAAAGAIGGFASSVSTSGASSSSGAPRVSTTPASRSSSFTPTAAPAGSTAAPAVYTHYVEITASGRNLKGALALETDRLGRVVGVK